MDQLPPLRRYGRQGEGRTTLSASLDADVAVWMRQQAAAAGLSVSAWLNLQLRAFMAQQGSLLK